MKITFNHDTITQAVSVAMGTVSNKSTVASIEGILIDAANGKCVMTSFDLDKGIRLELDADVERDGSYIINAQKLNQIVRAMPEGDITIEVDNRNITKISCGKSEFELHALNGSDFIKLPQLSGDISFQISQGILKKMISQVSFAIAQNDARPALNGALFNFSKNNLTVVSCDGNRLALCERKCEIKSDVPDVEAKCIIPGKTLTELIKILGDGDETITVELTRKNIIFCLDGLLFFSKLIDSEYIDYNRFIPKTSRVSVVLNSNDFVRCLERASLITEDRSAGQTKSAVKLDFKDNVLNVSSVSITGKVNDELSVEKRGDDIEIGFNCRYLIDALRSCDCESIKILMSTPLMSMLIEPADENTEDKFIFLVLPVKMQ